jgi:hypothetical protein
VSLAAHVFEVYCVHVAIRRRNGRRERRSQIRDHDGFVLIVTMHMYTIYMRVDWFENYLGRKDLHGYGYSISNYILRFLIRHISSIFRYNNIWLVITRLTLPLNLNLLQIKIAFE